MPSRGVAPCIYIDDARLSEDGLHLHRYAFKLCAFYIKRDDTLYISLYSGVAESRYIDIGM